MRTLAQVNLEIQKVEKKEETGKRTNTALLEKAGCTV